ncbi:MAG: protein kinase [Candidatus Riflebacteria bacterium]|nr:protein kinase [Candidatus Riflebacteria bacterium]
MKLASVRSDQGTGAEADDPGAGTLACPLCLSRATQRRGNGSVACRSCDFVFSVELHDQMRTLAAEAGPVGLTPRDSGATPVEVDEYRILEPLSGRGASVVLLALQVNLGRKVIMKVFGHRVSGNREAAGRFETTLQALAALQHPSIVRILSRGRTRDGRLYVTMEHVDGHTLRTALDRGLLDLPDRARTALGIAEALSHAHCNGLVHGDLRPENILMKKVGESLHLKVMGFALDAVLEEFDGHPDHKISILGARPYRAPEQRWDPRRVDRATDLYALGVVVYELLAGSLPVGLARPPSRLDSRIPREVDAVIARLLDQEPERRCQNPDEVVKVLRALAPPPSGDLTEEWVGPASEVTGAPTWITRPEPVDSDRMVIQGQAGPGQSIVIHVNGIPHANRANRDGMFSHEVALLPGQNQIIAETRTRRGSWTSEPLMITSYPPPPEILEAPCSCVGPSVSVRGRARPGSEIRASICRREVRTTAVADGTFALTCDVDEGLNLVRVHAELRGLCCRWPATVRIVRAVSPPRLAPHPVETLSSTVELVGASTPDNQIESLVNGMLVHCQVDPSGQFGFTVPLVEGANRITVWAIRTGVRSLPVGPVTIVRRCRAPARGMLGVIGIVALVALSSLAMAAGSDKTGMPGRTGSAATVLDRPADAPAGAIVTRATRPTVRPIGARPAATPRPPRIVEKRLSADGTRLELTGNVSASSTVTVTGPGGQTVAVTTRDGTFRASLALVPGDNLFTVTSSRGEIGSSATPLLITGPPPPPVVSRVSTTPGRRFVTLIHATVSLASCEVFMRKAGAPDSRRLTPSGSGHFETSAVEPLGPGTNRWLLWTEYKGLRSRETTLIVTAPRSLSSARRPIGR